LRIIKNDKKRLILDFTFGVAMFIATLAQNSNSDAKQQHQSVAHSQEIEKSADEFIISDDDDASSVRAGLSVELGSVPKHVAIRILETQDHVEEYFADVPVMADIAFCESRFRQYDASGNLFRGWVDSADVGVMQVNERYHLVDSKKLGYDIHTIDGNLGYARHLYEIQGLQPWKSSAKCWNVKNTFALK
jgi:hypothetical protein